MIVYSIFFLRLQAFSSGKKKRELVTNFISAVITSTINLPGEIFVKFQLQIKSLTPSLFLLNKISVYT